MGVLLEGARRDQGDSLGRRGGGPPVRTRATGSHTQREVLCFSFSLFSWVRLLGDPNHLGRLHFCSELELELVIGTL